MRGAATAFLLTCAAACCTPMPNPSCVEQGHSPGTREHQICQDARGNPLATGDGSPLNHEERVD